MRTLCLEGLQNNLLFLTGISPDWMQSVLNQFELLFPSKEPKKYIYFKRLGILETFACYLFCRKWMKKFIFKISSKVNHS
jgi:hypothetical protein